MLVRKRAIVPLTSTLAPDGSKVLTPADTSCPLRSYRPKPCRSNSSSGVFCTRLRALTADTSICGWNTAPARLTAASASSCSLRLDRTALLACSTRWTNWWRLRSVGSSGAATTGPATGTWDQAASVKHKAPPATSKARQRLSVSRAGGPDHALTTARRRAGFCGLATLLNLRAGRLASTSLGVLRIGGM